MTIDNETVLDDIFTWEDNEIKDFILHVARKHNLNLLNLVSEWTEEI